MGSRDSLFVVSLFVIFFVAVVAVVVMVRPLYVVRVAASSSQSVSSLTGAAIVAGDVPAAYAPPWDVFSGEQFLSVEPVSGGVKVVVDRPGGFVYHVFYVSDGDSWVAHSFGDDPWLVDGASAVVSAGDSEEYVIVYTCKRHVGAPDGWDCGCRSTSDTVCRAFAVQNVSLVSASSSACVVDADCDDSNACTLDSCLGGSCVNAPQPDDLSCVADSGVAGKCASGSCVPAGSGDDSGDDGGCSSNADCADGEECNANGECVPPSSGTLSGLNITACNKLFEDEYTNPMPGLYPGHHSLLGISQPPDWGALHTFNSWGYLPETKSLFAKSDAGVTSILLDDDLMAPKETKTVARILVQNTFVTGDGAHQTANGNCQDVNYEGYLSSAEPAGQLVANTFYSVYPDGTIISPANKFGRIGIFSGVGNDLTLESFFSSDGIMWFNLLHASCGQPRPPRNIDNIWTVFEKTGLSQVPYGRYKSIFQDGSKKRYGLLCPYDLSRYDYIDTSCTKSNPSDLYLVDITNPAMPSLKGKLSNYPVLLDYLSFDYDLRSFEQYPRHIYGSPGEDIETVSGPVDGPYRARVTLDDKKVTIFDLSDALNVQVVEKLPVPENSFFQGTSNKRNYPFWFVFHNKTLYFHFPTFGGKVYRHTIGQPGWEALDLGEYYSLFTDFVLSDDGKLLLKVFNINEEDWNYFKQHHKHKNMQDSSFDFSRNRRFFLYDITGETPNLISEGTLPYGYRDPELYHASSNKWSHFVDPILASAGDGTYRLFLRSASTDKVALYAFKLSPGPTDSSCVCQPDCSGKSCGDDDGCGGYCSYGNGFSWPDNSGCSGTNICMDKKGGNPVCLAS